MKKYNGHLYDIKLDEYKNTGLALMLENKYDTIYVSVWLEPLVGPYCYIDENNNPGVAYWLNKNRIATFTGRKKRNGYCEYPLMQINRRIYEKYNNRMHV